MTTESVARKSLETQLIPFSNRSAFQNIRNYLAGRFIGATRDRSLMDELFKCVFAKHWMIKNPSLASQNKISKSYRAAFAHVKKVIPGIFLDSDEIELDPAALQYVDQQLESIDLEKCRADIFSELYEAFAGSGIKSDEGQFFTPSVAVDLLVHMVNPRSDQTICDPACGAGGFLIAAAQHLTKNGSSPSEIANSIYGVDKDSYLTRIAKGRLALYLDEMPQIVCGDSLAGVSQNGEKIRPEQFDIILTNPPFGAKIIAATGETLARYELAKKWFKTEDEQITFASSGSMSSSTPPQILFLELCLNLLKPNGILGAILPESLVSAKSYNFVVQYLLQKAELISVVGMPEALFKTSGKGGTHTKTVAVVVQKKPTKSTRSTVFFADAKWCGHDSRGRIVHLNDVPSIKKNFDEFQKKAHINYQNLGISVPRNRLGLNLAPRAFEFDVEIESEKISKSHEIVAIADLVKSKIITISTGDEVGKLAYGTGDVPFVRTSDLSNWEIKLDAKHGVSEEVFSKFKVRQDVQPNDILMVKDGTYLIGTCAIVTKYDLPMLYQSHIYKIRTESRDQINPFLLLAALSSTFVQKQIKSFCVSQDIIDSLGGKILQLQIPIPKSADLCREISSIVEKAISDRMEARELAQKACQKIAPL